MAVVTIEKGVIKVDGRPILIPRDAQFTPTAVQFGLTTDGNLVPVKVDANGNLFVSAIDLNPNDIRIGAVEIQDDGSEERLDIVEAGDIVAGDDNKRGILIFGYDETGEIIALPIKKFDINNYAIDTTLKDSGGVSIDPATEQTLQEVLAAIKGGSVLNNSIKVGRKFDVNSGQFNTFELYPEFFNQGCTQDGVIVAQLDNTITNAVQVFKAQDDNITSLDVYMGCEFAPAIVDDFESTFDWTSTDPVNTSVNLDNSVVYEGIYSMRIGVKRNQSAGDQIIKTFTTEQDWSGESALSLQIYGSRLEAQVYFSLHIEDVNGNSVTSDFSVSQLNTWEAKMFSFESMTKETVGNIDWTRIKKIYFTVEKDKQDGVFYIDYIRVITNFGTAEIRLYDFGTNPTPTSLPTPITLDNGTDFCTVTVLNEALTRYHVYLLVGLKTDGIITPGNYYGIGIVNKSQNVILNVYGTTSDFYQDGSLFTSTDNGSTLVDIGKDLSFIIYINQACELYGIKMHFDTAVGQCKIYGDIQSKSLVRTTFLVSELLELQDYSFTLSAPVALEKKEWVKIEFYDDPTQPTKNVLLEGVFRK